MRFLPYLLVAAMTVPILIWVFISNFVIRGSSSSFQASDLWILAMLGAIVLSAFYLLSTWMHRAIRETSE